MTSRDVSAPANVRLDAAEVLAARLDRPMGYEASLATITGSGFTVQTGFAKILHVGLATYSVAVFATLAGTLGAYFLRGQPTQHASVAVEDRPGEDT